MGDIEAAILENGQCRDGGYLGRYQIDLAGFGGRFNDFVFCDGVDD